MFYFKPMLHFRLKTMEETIDECLTDKSIIIKNKIQLSTPVFNVDKIKASIKEHYKQKLHFAQKHMKALEEFYDLNKDFIAQEFARIFSLSDKGETLFKCSVSFFSEQKINFYDKSIQLSLKESPRNSVNFAVSSLLKLYCLKYLLGNEKGIIDFSYENANKYWIVAEIIADAVAYNSGLKNYEIKPAYNFYYQLKIKNENVIDKMRETCSHLPLKCFTMFVLSYVEKYYEFFSSFKYRI